MNIVVIEKRRSIGEVNGITLHVWEFSDLVKQKDFPKWCTDRGYGKQYIPDGSNFVPVYVDIRATIKEIK